MNSYTVKRRRNTVKDGVFRALLFKTEIKSMNTLNLFPSAVLLRRQPWRQLALLGNVHACVMTGPPQRLLSILFLVLIPSLLDAQDYLDAIRPLWSG